MARKQLFCEYFRYYSAGPRGLGPFKFWTGVCEHKANSVRMFELYDSSGCPSGNCPCKESLEREFRRTEFPVVFKKGAPSLLELDEAEARKALGKRGYESVEIVEDLVQELQQEEAPAIAPRSVQFAVVDHGPEDLSDIATIPVPKLGKEESDPGNELDQDQDEGSDCDEEEDVPDIPGGSDTKATTTSPDAKKGQGDDAGVPTEEQVGAMAYYNEQAANAWDDGEGTIREFLAGLMKVAPSRGAAKVVRERLAASKVPVPEGVNERSVKLATRALRGIGMGRKKATGAGSGKGRGVDSKKPVVTEVVVGPTEFRLRVDETVQLRATVRGKNLKGADMSVMWMSGNPELASVEDGIVTALGPGEVVIKAMSLVDETKIGEARITVEAAEPAPPPNPNPISTTTPLITFIMQTVIQRPGVLETFLQQHPKAREALGHRCLREWTEIVPLEEKKADSHENDAV